MSDPQENGTAPNGGTVNKFVIVYNDGTIRAVTENIVSRMYDLADCDYMDNVRAVYALDEHAQLVPVTVHEQRKYDDFDANSQVYFASSKITAGKRIVGFVHWSDH